MREIYATLEKCGFELDERREAVEVAALSFFAFSIPFLFPGPQLLTGIAVNAFLAAAALRVRGWKLLPVILLPSMGALANCFVFGPLTIFLIYLIPFIWMGNFLFVYGIKHFALGRGTGFWWAGAVSAVAKSIAIFIPAYALFSVGVLPQAMLFPMGPMQLVTAAGGVAIVGAGKEILKGKI
ncbi:MAG: hypothetical protein QXH30_01940 [Candidatus Bilamarchaeaceae archaeon]